MLEIKQKALEKEIEEMKLYESEQEEIQKLIKQL